MLKNIKYIALFSLIVIYMIQLGTLFIGDFATELQELRRQHQIAKTEFIETKTLVLSHWNSIEEKEEIFLDNAYYDVVSYKIENGFVYLEAVRDTFDISFKIALKLVKKLGYIQFQTREIPSNASEIDNIDDVFEKNEEVNIFRIIQESMSNIVKHAKAQASRISISKLEDRIIVSIEDNGVGYDFYEKYNQTNSLGLKTMLERTKFLKGQMKVQSKVGNGTLIKYTFPIA